MAIPALPSDDSDANDWNAAKVNAISDHLQLWRDTRPLFKGVAVSGTVATSTFVDWGHGTSSATFQTAPITNVGSFAVSSDANPDGRYNVEVPEAGHYEGTWHLVFAADNAGLRRADPQLNSSTITAASVLQISAGSALETRMSVPFEVDCTAAGDELSVLVWQNSGSGSAVTAWLSVKWVQST